MSTGLSSSVMSQTTMLSGVGQGRDLNATVYGLAMEPLIHFIAHDLRKARSASSLPLSTQSVEFRSGCVCTQPGCFMTT